MNLNASELAAIRRTPLFSQLPVSELEAILGNATHRRLGNGALLFAEGDPAHSFYFVQEGGIRLFKLASNGTEKVIELILEGEMFAEAVGFLGGQYPVSADALYATTVIEIPSQNFLQVFRSNPDLATRMLAALSMRLRQLITHIQALSLETAGQRVSRYLLEQAPGGAMPFSLPAQKNVVASRLGITPETFSRVLATLRAQGLVNVEGAILTLPDPAALRTWGDLQQQG